MRLTESIRSAFVLAAMEDVPSVDYESQAAKVILAAVSAALPPKVAAVWNDHETRGYLKPVWQTNSSNLPGVAIPVKFDQLDKGSLDTAKGLMARQREQGVARRELGDKLRSVASACNTRKQLAEALPEFVKYLPAEAQAAANLPAIANVVADFMAAGWPKGKQPQPKRGSTLRKKAVPA